MNDTIAAISTALGVGAISIVRLSGEDSINIVNKIFDKDLYQVIKKLINNILEEKNIEFKTQYTFNDLRSDTGTVLRFDFAIFNNN